MKPSDEAFEKWWKWYEGQIVGAPNDTSKAAKFIACDAWDAALLHAQEPQGDTCTHEPKHPKACLREGDVESGQLAGTCHVKYCLACEQIKEVIAEAQMAERERCVHLIVGSAENVFTPNQRALADKIRCLSPDPSWLDRKLREAQAAAVEMCAKVVDEWMLPIVIDNTEGACIRTGQKSLAKALRSLSPTNALDRIRDEARLEEENPWSRTYPIDLTGHVCGKVSLDSGVVSYPDTIEEIGECREGCCTNYRCKVCLKTFTIEWPD